MRLFIALPLPDHLKEYLGRIIDQFRQHPAKVKWVDPGNIHLTLKFLGETDEKLAPNISESINVVSQQFNPVAATIDKLGGFPNIQKARVYWAGYSNPPWELAEIAGHVDREMRKLRFEEEKRSFKSHLTIGRVKDFRTLDSLAGEIDSFVVEKQQCTFEEIVLFQSTLTPRGPIYNRLFAAKLKKEETFS